ncbi:MAG: hypothetical protein AB7G13_10905 [Lautropia sp.]
METSATSDGGAASASDIFDYVPTAFAAATAPWQQMQRATTAARQSIGPYDVIACRLTD